MIRKKYQDQIIKYIKTCQKEGFSVTANIQHREAVMPSQFLSLPPAGPATGLAGYYASPQIGVWHSHVSGALFTGATRENGVAVPNLIPKDPRVEGIQRRSADTLRLPPWDDEDRKRLGLKRKAVAASLPPLPTKKERSTTDTQPPASNSVPKSPLSQITRRRKP